MGQQNPQDSFDDKTQTIQEQKDLNININIPPNDTSELQQQQQQQQQQNVNNYTTLNEEQEQDEQQQFKSYIEDQENHDDVNNSNIDEDQNGVYMFWKKVQLNKGISKTNFIASLFHYLFMTFIFVSVEILQPVLLQQKFDIQPQNAGTQNSNLILIDVGVKLIFAPIFGVMADKLGRKWVLLYGICVVGIAIMLMPYSNSLYNGYLIYRCIYAHGAICVAIIPLLADYVADSTKGRASGLTVIMASFGAMLSAQVVAGSLVSKNINLNICYSLVGGGYLLCSITYCLFLKGGLPNFRGDPSRIRTPEKSCTFLIKIGFQASQNPWILMGYITNLMARSDSILLSIYLIIWTFDQTDQQDFDKANYQGHSLAGIAYMSLFLFTILYGVLMERMSKFIIIFTMLFLTCLGCFMMVFATQPTGYYIYIVMVVLGSGMSGLQTAAQYLIQKYAYKNHRGYITGLSGIFSVLGILLCVASGYLIDSVSDVAPFISMSIISFLSILLLGYCYCLHRRKALKWAQENEKSGSIDLINLQKMNASEREDLVYQKQEILLQKEK